MFYDLVLSMTPTHMHLTGTEMVSEVLEVLKCNIIILRLVQIGISNCLWQHRSSNIIIMSHLVSSFSSNLINGFTMCLLPACLHVNEFLELISFLYLVCVCQSWFCRILNHHLTRVSLSKGEKSQLFLLVINALPLACDSLCQVNRRLIKYSKCHYLYFWLLKLHWEVLHCASVKIATFDWQNTAKSTNDLSLCTIVCCLVLHMVSQIGSTQCHMMELLSFVVKYCKRLRNLQMLQNSMGADELHRSPHNMTCTLSPSCSH